MSNYRDDDMIGGDTPFISPAALPFHRHAMSEALGHEHRPLRFGLQNDANDKDTRTVKLALCALAYADYDRNGRAAISGLTRDEFMRGFVGGANTDLMAMGITPLISLTEVARLAEHPDIQKAVAGDTGAER